MRKTIKFNIEVEMSERWKDDFCSFLKYMESCGSAGCSRQVSFFVDGDGDFRPKFKIGIDFASKDGISRGKILDKADKMFDAG